MLPATGPRSASSAAFAGNKATQSLRGDSKATSKPAQTLEELERRAGMLMQQLFTLNRELDANASDEVMDVASIVHSQTEAIARVAHDLTRVHENMEQLRSMYHFFSCLL